jgi:Zn-dependent protease
MPSSRQGSIRLFRFSGIDVFLHWSWFLFAVFEISNRTGSYSSRGWNVLEYLSLFCIVTLHEFGHALACRQVGGIANQIVLWPLGGVAYVNPPPRAGATLWSIAAGPLVNVVLIPVLFTIGMLTRSLGDGQTLQDVRVLVHSVWIINLVLLGFNLLPVYPLDGGQIFRSLLWFLLGRARSLMAATVVGFIGAIGFIALAWWTQSIWLGFISVYMLMNCWGGWQHARALWRMEKLPRREGYACPQCKAAPPIGEVWQCGQCRQAFDTFTSQAVCPYCKAQFAMTHCLYCGRQSPMREWMSSVLVPPGA